jgi:Protein of unknown function (DUF1194)
LQSASDRSNSLWLDPPYAPQWTPDVEGRRDTISQCFTIACGPDSGDARQREMTVSRAFQTMHFAFTDFALIGRVPIIPLFLMMNVAANSPASSQIPVELELALAVDVSSSATLQEFQFQTGGIAAAFGDPEIIAAIEDLQPLGLAICLIHWSATSRQNVAVDWTVLKDKEAALQFANNVESVQRSFLGDTAIGPALEFAAAQIETNSFHGLRKTIDLSGDGGARCGIRARKFRDRLVKQNITINGLEILTDDPDLDLYYRDNVIGGLNSFVTTAADFSDFRRAIKYKLHREIIPLTALNLPTPHRRADSPDQRPPIDGNFSISGLRHNAAKEGTNDFRAGRAPVCCVRRH